MGVFSDQFLVWFSYNDGDTVAINGTKYNMVEVMNLGLKQAKDVTVFTNGQALDPNLSYCLEGRLNIGDRITEIHFDKMSPYQKCSVYFNNSTKPIILAITAENRISEPAAKIISVFAILILMIPVSLWNFVPLGLFIRNKIVASAINKRYVEDAKHVELVKELQKFYSPQLTKFDAAIIFEIFAGSKTDLAVAQNLKFPKSYVKRRIRIMRKLHILILRYDVPYPNEDIVDLLKKLRNPC